MSTPQDPPYPMPPPFPVHDPDAPPDPDGDDPEPDPLPSARDPRTDPRQGDQLRGDGQTRRVIVREGDMFEAPERRAGLLEAGGALGNGVREARAGGAR